MKACVDIDRQLDVLFTRLEWPSGVIKERASSAIAGLLCLPDYAETTNDYLTAWVAKCNFESTAACGILIAAIARDRGSLAVKPDRLLSAVARPSLLSWQLLSGMLGDDGPPIEGFLVHSGDIPQDFQAADFFQRHIRAFLLPVYSFMSDTIQEQYGFEFGTRWAFEWSCILDREDVQPDASILRFWLGIGPHDEQYLTADLPLSEVYRSAFLRALAWSVTDGRLSVNVALSICAKTCPIDLELAKFAPSRRPKWWPSDLSSDGLLDTIPADALKAVDELWRRNMTGGEWAIAEFGGRVHNGDSFYDISVGVGLQKCVGPREADSEDLSKWYFDGMISYSGTTGASFYSPLRTAGVLPSASLNDMTIQIDDWLVVPLALRLHPATLPLWQRHRIHRGIWMPASYLASNSLSFYAHDGALGMFDGDTLIGRWFDWGDGLRDRGIDIIPPGTGQCLELRKDTVDEAVERAGASLIWVCKLTAYTREHSYSEYKVHEHSWVTGGTRLIL